MPAKAPVPVEVSLRHRPLSGPWAPPTGTIASIARGRCATNCRSGPCPRKRRFRSRCLCGIDRFRGHGSLLQKPSLRSRVVGALRTVGAGHARESAGSGRCVSMHPPLSGAWPPPTETVASFARGRCTARDVSRSPCAAMRWRPRRRACSDGRASPRCVMRTGRSSSRMPISRGCRCSRRPRVGGIGQ